MPARKLPSRNPKPKGPSRTSPTVQGIPADAIAAGNPTCWAGCGRAAVKYKHHQWWCLKDTPPDHPDCTHPITSPFRDKLLCSYCGEFVKHEL